MRTYRHVVGCVLGLMLLTGLTPSSHGWTDATTRATATLGKFDIRGVTGSAIHTHGGASAQLGHVVFIFTNRSNQPRRVSVVDIEFLQGRDCEQPPQRVVSHLKSGGILLDDGQQRESAAQVTVKAGATINATVGFSSVPAYYAYCDRFAFRVHFQIDREKVGVTVEVKVSREEPLRPRE